MSHQTYAETAVLAAIMDEDVEEADRLLADFLPGELSRFVDQAEELADRIAQAQRNAARRPAPQRPDTRED